MKVIFLQDVPGTADAGEVKEVKNGFARNYLLPRKLAAPATVDQMQRIGTIEKAAQETRLKLSSDATVVAKELDGREITIQVRVGPSGRLFGAVTGRHIADELNKLTGRNFDHRNVLLGQAIHDPGDYEVAVRLYREVTVQVKVSVIPEGYSPESGTGDDVIDSIETSQDAEDETEVGEDKEVPESD